MPNEHKDTQVDKDSPCESLIDRLWAEVDMAATLEPVSRRGAALEAVCSTIDSLPERERTATVLWMLGYAWYCHPDRRSSRAIQEKVESALRAAIMRDPTYARAWMYLGHNAYDLGRYEMARDFFSRADPTQLSEYWRMKLLEMRLCSGVAVDGLACHLQEIDEFVQVAELLPPQDIWPVQLARWIREQGPLLPDHDRARLKRLAQRLDRAGLFTDWLSSLA